MNVLAHRNIGQMEVRGTVEVNDCPIGSQITATSAYIQQEDLFVGSLTVREHLTFQVVNFCARITIKMLNRLSFKSTYVLIAYIQCLDHIVLK